MKNPTPNDRPLPLLGDDWVDPLEEAVRHSIRGFIEVMIGAELDSALGRGRYRRDGDPLGHRNGRRERQLIGTFGAIGVSLPWARLLGDRGQERAWRDATLPASKRITRRAEALIVGVYLAGTNGRRRAARFRACSAARRAQAQSAALGTSCGPTGRPGRRATWLATTSCDRSSTAPWSTCGSTTAPPRSPSSAP